MKFFRKRFLAIALLFCLTFSLFACGPKDSASSVKKPGGNAATSPATAAKPASLSTLIIGTWVPENMRGVVGGESRYLDANDVEAVGVMTFHEDGSLSGFDSATATSDDGFYWQIKQNILILANGTSTVKYSIINLDNDNLVIRLDLGSLEGSSYKDGDYIEGTYKKQG